MLPQDISIRPFQKLYNNLKIFHKLGTLAQTPLLWRYRQEDPKFKVNSGYTASSGRAYAPMKPYNSTHTHVHTQMHRGKRSLS